MRLLTPRTPGSDRDRRRAPHGRRSRQTQGRALFLPWPPIRRAPHGCGGERSPNRFQRAHPPADRKSRRPGCSGSAKRDRARCEDGVPHDRALLVMPWSFSSEAPGRRGRRIGWPCPRSGGRRPLVRHRGNEWPAVCRSAAMPERAGDWTFHLRDGKAGGRAQDVARERLSGDCWPSGCELMGHVPPHGPACWPHHDGSAWAWPERATAHGVRRSITSGGRAGDWTATSLPCSRRSRLLEWPERVAFCGLGRNPIATLRN